MSAKLVSIIMPVYNGEKTIELALKSLLSQTYKNWVCIIVNDGSNDGTKEILDSLTDYRFKVIHLEINVGRGAARQIALDNTEGDYLTYLDADDFYHSDKLEKQVTALEENNNIALVGCRALIIDGVFEPTSTRGQKIIAPMVYNYGANLSVVLPTSMIKLEEAKKIKYNPELKASEDLDYFSRYLKDKSYISLNDILFYYAVTESTNYKKILVYSWYSVVYGFTILTNSNNYKVAIKTIFTSTFKFITYLLLIPILGSNYFISRRGKPVSKDDILHFQVQKKLISQKNLL